MTDRLNVAVVGVGRLGSIHARIYAEIPETELVAVVDVDEARAAEVARRFGTTAVSDPADLFGKVSAVSIVTPTSSHHPYYSSHPTRCPHCPSR